MAHDHGSTAAAHRGRLAAVLILSLAVLTVEVVGGIAANSLALLADAGHVLTDVAGVGMALLAIWFAGRSPTNGRTFGPVEDHHRAANHQRAEGLDLNSP